MFITQDLHTYKLYVDTCCHGTYSNIMVTNGKETYYGASICGRIEDMIFLITDTLKEIDSSNGELHVEFGIDGKNLVHSTMPSEHICSLRSVGINMSDYLPKILIDELWQEIMMRYYIPNKDNKQ